MESSALWDEETGQNRKQTKPASCVTQATEFVAWFTNFTPVSSIRSKIDFRRSAKPSGIRRDFSTGLYPEAFLQSSEAVNGHEVDAGVDRSSGS